jgi:hypothetical protein
MPSPTAVKAEWTRGGRRGLVVVERRNGAGADRRRQGSPEWHLLARVTIETVSVGASFGRWLDPGPFDQSGHRKGRDAPLFPTYPLTTGGDTLFLVIPLHGSAGASN